MKTISLKNSTKKVLVDDEDYLRVNLFRWTIDNARVRRTTLPQVTIQAFIMKDTINMYDHIDRNFLNNQKENLRIATQQQNCFNRNKRDGNNTSRYKGVSWNNTDKRWHARITKNSITKFLGLFDSEEAAAKAYDVIAIKYFGEFAKLNFPIEKSEV